MRARAQGQLTACKSNQKNIGVALDMYAVDHQGAYPRDLPGLLPNYLKTLPECPAAEKMSYAVRFGPGPEGKPEYYEIRCAGENHSKAMIPADYPRLHSVDGLVERP